MRRQEMDGGRESTRHPRCVPAHDREHADLLEQAKRRDEQAQQRRRRQHRDDRAPPPAFSERPSMVRLDPRSRPFDELAVGDAGGACRLAPTAAETEIEVTDGIVVEREAPLLQRTHQMDASARRIGLGTEREIRGARVLAEAAVNAIEEALGRNETSRRYGHTRWPIHQSRPT